MNDRTGVGRRAGGRAGGRAGDSPSDSPSVARIRRLRWRLTAFYTGASMVGLVLLALLATITDGRVRDDALFADMERLSAFTDDYISTNANRSIDTTNLENSGVLLEADVYIVSRPTSGGPPKITYRSPNLALAVSDETIVRFAADSLSGVANDNFREVTPDGHPVMVGGMPQYDDNDAVVAASITVLDARSNDEERRAFLLVLWTGVLLLTMASAALGSLIARRSIAPAMASLSQQERFLADAAHELRTPLAALRTTIEAGQLVGADAVAALERAASLAAETSGTVDDLLLLARMDAGSDLRRPEPVRLDLLVDEVVADYPQVTARSAEVVVSVDVALIRRAIRNLVANALKHGEGVEVQVVVGWTADGGSAYIHVVDRGPGIDPAVLDTMFDRFVTGRRSSGSGLGMAIVSEIADSHGGSVRASNRTDGPGAEFVFTVPVNATGS